RSALGPAEKFQNFEGPTRPFKIFRRSRPRTSTPVRRPLHDPDEGVGFWLRDAPECIAGSAGLTQARLIISGGWYVPAGAHRLQCCLDLLIRCFGHPGVPGSFGQSHHGDALITETHGPVERHALAGSFHEGVAIGGDRLLQPRRPALALAERS